MASGVAPAAPHTARGSSRPSTVWPNVVVWMVVRDAVHDGEEALDVLVTGGLAEVRRLRAGQEVALETGGVERAGVGRDVGVAAPGDHEGREEKRSHHGVLGKSPEASGVTVAASGPVRARRRTIHPLAR